jgi:hypothetical protein
LLGGLLAYSLIPKERGHAKVFLKKKSKRNVKNWTIQKVRWKLGIVGHVETGFKESVGGRDGATHVILHKYYQ